MLKLKWRRTVIVHRPVEEVFDFVGTHFFENYPKYGGVTFEKTSVGPVGVGTTARYMAADARGRPVETMWTFTEFEPNRKRSIRSRTVLVPLPDVQTSSKRRSYASRETASTSIFEPVSGGTRIRSQHELWLGGTNWFWNALYIFLYGRAYKKQSYAAGEKLLDCLEGPSNRRRAVAFLYRICTWWFVFFAVLVGLIWVNGARYDLQLSADVTRAVQTAIGLMVAFCFALPVIWGVSRRSG